jgi:hypothetical protein
MSWIPPSFRSSFQAILRRSSEQDRSIESRQEDIRQAMIKALEHKDWHDHSNLGDRIMFAEELMDLWFLRSELMQVVSSRYGELMAHRALHAISDMFDGLLPKNMNYRPRYLGNV